MIAITPSELPRTEVSLRGRRVDSVDRPAARADVVAYAADRFRTRTPGGNAMQGLMQDRPLTLDHFFDRAETLFPKKEVVTATGHRHRARVPTASGPSAPAGSAACSTTSASPPTVGSATFAWNTARHLELYFAAPCSGRVLHTLNIRLFPEQLTYIVNHAEDEVIFVDQSLLGLLWPLLDTFETVRHIVVMDDGRGEVPEPRRRSSAARLRGPAGRGRPGRVATSTTRTGPRRCATRAAPPATPRASSTRHRSTWLHTAGVMMADSLGACERDTILPVVPMFHANAWGLAHAGVACGANLVMPGPDLSPPAIADLIEQREGHRRRRRAHHLDGRAARAQGPRHLAACGPSRAAARRCPGTCRRPTASRSACRSSRPGA